MQSTTFKKFETQFHQNLGVVDYLFYLEVVDHHEQITDCFLPNGRFELIADLGDQVSYFGKSAEWQIRPKVSVLGHHTHSVRLSCAGPKFQCVGAVFSLGKMAALIPDPAKRQYGSPTRLDNYFDNATNTLIHELQLAQQVHQKIHVLDRFIHRHVTVDHKQPAFLDHSLQLIDQHKGRISVADISKRVHCSTRHLRRSFIQHFGISPKALSSIIRLNYAVAQMINSNVAMSDIISDHGYFDRAHFYKEFTRIAGMPPSVYFNHARKLSRHFFETAIASPKIKPAISSMIARPHQRVMR